MIGRKDGTLITTTAYYVIMAILALPFLLPLLWMIATAFKTPGQIYGDPLQLIPQPPTLANFTGAWNLLDFRRFILNSAFITALTMVGTLFSSSLVGYAFATLSGRGKTFLFGLLLATLIVPPTVTLIPTFILFSKLGWLNTYLPLIVPHYFANGFYVFLFRQAYLSLPTELFDSAEIDGCNPLTAYRWIALPLSRPALITVAVFSFIAAWNDFLGPLIYLSSTHTFTVSLGLSLFQGLFYSQLHYLMPMSLVALLPVLVLFVLAQRFFVQGVVTTGLKG